MITVHLKPHKEESLLRFHPWVFSGAISSIQLDKDYPYDTPKEGEIVQVVDSNGNILGVGHYQIGSIAVRILSFGASALPADFWQERIRAAYDVRCSLGLIIAENNTYRLVHGEGDFLPGLIVDVYADTAVIQAHSVGMHQHRQEIAESIVEIVPQVNKVYYKSDDTLPHKALIQGERVGYLIGADKADFNGDFGRKRMGWIFVSIGCADKKQVSLLINAITALYWNSMRKAKKCLTCFVIRVVSPSMHSVAELN